MINQIRKHMNRAIHTHSLYKDAAKEAHSRKLYKDWSAYMHLCKEIKQRIKVLAHWLHTLLYATNVTKVTPRVDKSITVDQLYQILKPRWYRQAE